MRLKFLTGVTVSIALASAPAFACNGRKTAFFDNFARQDPSWTPIVGEFGVSNGRAQLKSPKGKFAAVGNSGDYFESGELCLDVFAPDYRGGSNEFGGILFGSPTCRTFMLFG